VPTIMNENDNQTGLLPFKTSILFARAFSNLPTKAYSVLEIFDDLLPRFAVELKPQLWLGTTQVKSQQYFLQCWNDTTKNTAYSIKRNSTLMKNLMMLSLVFVLFSSNLWAQSTVVSDNGTQDFSLKTTSNVRATWSDMRLLVGNDGPVDSSFTFENHTFPSATQVQNNETYGADTTIINFPFTRMTINSKVGIGTNDPDEQLVVYNGATTGTYTSSGWMYSSDTRLKKNIKPLNFDMAKVLRLEAKRYNYKNENADSAGAHIGFITQEVELLFPEFVRTGSNGYKAIAYGEMVPVLVEAIKLQQADIEQMEHMMSLQEKQLQKMLMRILELEYNQGESANR